MYILGFTGVDAAYERPLNPEVSVKAGKVSVDECVQEIVTYLAEKVMKQSWSRQSNFLSVK